jgi:hypothetical protein
MTTIEQAIFDFVGTAVKEAPEFVDMIERAIGHHKPKRVEEVRPAESFTDQAIDDLKRGE